MRLYLQFSDWFGTKRTFVWFQINRRLISFHSISFIFLFPTFYVNIATSEVGEGPLPPLERGGGHISAHPLLGEIQTFFMGNHKIINHNSFNLTKIMNHNSLNLTKIINHNSPNAAKQNSILWWLEKPKLMSDACEAGKIRSANFF